MEMELLRKEYGLCLLGCVLDELSKTPGFERLAIAIHAHNLLVKGCADEAAAFADNAEYAALKNNLDTILADKKARLVTLLEVENIPTMISSGV
jgi:hypothetical protein